METHVYFSFFAAQVWRLLRLERPMQQRQQPRGMALGVLSHIAFACMGHRREGRTVGALCHGVADVTAAQN
eukprot:326417-Chlamydomonas_euryale.AAC.4